MGFFSEQKIVQFNPEKWQQGVGQNCQTCKARLEPQDCNSLCNCNLVSHQNCFLKQYAPYLTERYQIKCTKCQKLIKMKFHYIYRWECNKTPLTVISILVAFAILVAVLVLTLTNCLDWNFGWIFFAAGLVILIVVIICSQRRKYINLDKVKIVNSANPPKKIVCDDLRPTQADLYNAQTQNNIVRFDIQ